MLHGFQYQVVGRALPTTSDEHPKIYRMKLWAMNEVRAKSKFWYFLRKVKKSNGQVLAINERNTISQYLQPLVQGRHTLGVLQRHMQNVIDFCQDGTPLPMSTPLSTIPTTERRSKRVSDRRSQQ
ncbi:60S ribosomal protein L18a [Acorus calamus]|uniref:60S ribosomal protein L18a n=1 Tax=Acorus calamus TaxID=4465 RepID=A0AAV9CWT3_ACOCL|nr:60S ribosomal protein L18a [Acorus calamus]